jgi:hypothetical protein
MSSKLFSIILTSTLLIFFANSLNLKSSSLAKVQTTQDSPNYNVVYFKDAISWFAKYGLQQYYGTYCEQ